MGFIIQTILLRLAIVYKRYGIKQRKIKIWKLFVVRVVKKLLLEDGVLEVDGKTQLVIAETNDVENCSIL
jgi:hypothetical protein